MICDCVDDCFGKVFDYTLLVFNIVISAYTKRNTWYGGTMFAHKVHKKQISTPRHEPQNQTIHVMTPTVHPHEEELTLV